MRTHPLRHPLRLAEVMRHAHATMPGSDSEYWLVCARCDYKQTLAEAVFEPAEDPHAVSTYRCTFCGLELVTTASAEGPGPERPPRYRMGDYVVAVHVKDGLKFTTTSG